MKELILNLRTLVEADFFSPTRSRMAKELGRKDKNLLYDRLFECAEDGMPTLGQTAFDSLWQDICFSYNISDYTLTHLADIWRLAHVLADVCTEDDFLPLVRQRLSVVKDNSLRSELRALAKASVLDYCYVLAIYYALAKHLDPNAHKNTHVLIEVLQQVDAILRKCYPENQSAHHIANDYIDQVRSVKLLGWCHLMNIVGRLVCVYSHPAYLDEVISDGMVALPIGEQSWWMAEGADTEKTMLYYVYQPDEDSAVYYVLAVEADRNEDIDAAHCRYYRWGFLRDYEVLRCVEPNGSKLLHWGYYDYAFVEDEQMICLRPNKELNGKSTPIAMPDTLVRVPWDSPWGKWIESLDEDAVLDILAHRDVASMGLEMTDYEVLDVVLSRHTCQVCYQQGKQQMECAELSLDKYPLLKKISVWDDVLILRGPADQRLYALWPDRGLVIQVR